MKDNLTLSLGLRYEYWGTVETSCSSSDQILPGIRPAREPRFPNMYAYQQQPDRNNFAPRLGFAYTPQLGRGSCSAIKRGHSRRLRHVTTTGCIPTSWTTPPHRAPQCQWRLVLSAAVHRIAARRMHLEQLGEVTPLLNPHGLLPDTISNKLVNPVTPAMEPGHSAGTAWKMILTTVLRRHAGARNSLPPGLQA